MHHEQVTCAATEHTPLMTCTFFWATAHTVESIFVLDQDLFTLGVGGMVGLLQSPPGLLGNLGLLECLGKAHHWHVLPLLALAFVVLLHT